MVLGDVGVDGGAVVGELPVALAENVVSRSFLARALDGFSDADELARIESAIVVLVTVVLYRPFLALTFNRDKAQTLGMRPDVAQAALLALLALSIVASFQAIGTLLVFGLLVGPPATASLLARRVPTIMIVSIAFGALAVVAGLQVSFHHGTAGGATIAGFSVAQFFVVLAGRELATFLTKSAHTDTPVPA